MIISPGKRGTAGVHLHCASLLRPRNSDPLEGAACIICIFYLSLIEPLLSLTVLPHSLPFYTLLVCIDTFAGLFSMGPASFVLSTVFIDEFAMSMSQSFIELPCILFAVWPNHMSMTLHCIVNPITSELLPVAPDVDSFPLYQIHVELTLVD